MNAKSDGLAGGTALREVACPCVSGPPASTPPDAPHRPSADQLRAAFAYDPATGILTAKATTGSRKAGAVAGHISASGYVEVSFGGKVYKAHVLAWVIHHGEWPARILDHRNTVRSDNAIDNLRLASDELNHHNLSKATARNKLGVLGVSPHRGKFRASIQRQVNGKRKQISLGTHLTVEAASAAYQKAKASVLEELSND